MKICTHSKGCKVLKCPHQTPHEDFGDCRLAIPCNGAQGEIVVCVPIVDGVFKTRRLVECGHCEEGYYECIETHKVESNE